MATVQICRGGTGCAPLIASHPLKAKGIVDTVTLTEGVTVPSSVAPSDAFTLGTDASVPSSLAAAGSWSLTDTAATTSSTDSTGSTVTALFYDGFESGDFTHSENGYSWSGPSGSVDNSSSDGAPVYAGSHAARFRQGVTQENRKLPLQADSSAQYLTEFWFDYRIRIPGTGAPVGEDAPYNHTCSTKSQNNKWTEFFYAPNRAELLIWSEMWRNNAQDGGSRQTVIWEGSGHDTITQNGIVVPSERGEWHRWRYHLKLTTIDSNTFGLWYEVWKDDTQIYNNSTIEYEGSLSSAHNIGVFQIMGWNNCNFLERVTWYVDEVYLYDQDPGW